MSEPAPELPTAAPAPASAGALLGLAGPLSLVLLAGLAMPPHHGWLVPMGLAVAMVVVGERRLRRVAQARGALGGGAGGTPARLALLTGALGSIAVLLTVLARGVGTLLVEVPASLWGAGAAMLAALAWAPWGARLPARARPVVLLLLAAMVALAGVAGTRFEAAGPDARGWAHSGPILGIHPFQTTSILVDGEGPFDLPINDYVEPTGDRGYDPVGLADALDRALASIAERVYPHGPARVRQALIDAEVEAVITPGVWERLDRPPFEDTQPRIVVRSGSWGRGSRIEFVCPGRRIDPRGAQGETVMNRMCADKYASEASAGLGVTGRWSGYSEGRGQDRAGLHALWGWTRGDDEQGRRTLERETRWWAWITLGVVGLLLLRPLARVGEGLRGVGGALGALAVGLLVILAASGLGEPAVGALVPAAGPSWSSWSSLAPWAPVLALGSLGLFALDGPVVAASEARAEGRRIAAPAVVVVVATLALASVLPALEWLAPIPIQGPLQGAGGAQWLTFVRGVADALDGIVGLTIFEIEGAVAAALVGLLLGGAMACASAGVAAITQLGPGPGPSRRTVALVLGVLVVAGLLVISRKTAGAAALVPGVVGMTLVLGSGLLRLVPREPGALEPAPWAARWGLVAHLGWTGLGAALVWAALEPLPEHPFVLFCTVVGLAMVTVAGLALVPSGGILEGPRPDSDPALERHGKGRL